MPLTQRGDSIEASSGVVLTQGCIPNMRGSGKLGLIKSNLEEF